MRSEAQIALIEKRLAALEETLQIQGEINLKIITALQELREQDKAPQSGLILPDRLNS